MILKDCLYQHFHLSYELLFFFFFFLQTQVFDPYSFLFSTFCSQFRNDAFLTGTENSRQTPLTCCSYQHRQQDTLHTVLLGENKVLAYPCWYHEVSSACCGCCPPYQYVSDPYSYIRNPGWLTNVPFVGVIQVTNLKYEQGSVWSYCICKSFLKLGVIPSTCLAAQCALASCHSQTFTTTAMSGQLTSWNQTGLQCTNGVWSSQGHECNLPPLIPVLVPLKVCSEMENIIIFLTYFHVEALQPVLVILYLCATPEWHVCYQHNCS